MGHERSKPLHNFTLPCGLKWGHQRYLRCAKVDSNGQIASLHQRSNGSELIERRREEALDAAVINRRKSKGAATTTGGDGIATVREKLMFDLQEETDKMKETIFRDGLVEKELYPTPAPASTMTAATADASRPWNLRTRRAACKAPINGAAGNNGGSKVDVIRTTNGSSPIRTDQNKSPRLRSEFAGAGDSSPGEKKRATFSVSLSRKEIEEDFMAMVGHRPPRRPKKRAKLVQKNLDTLFPGLWLTEITPDLYKVPDDQ
ncbi:hypothetical protein K7X08_006738 [Anisodus acutangulus]|uniref:Uncharacterized protein n=1 Tax=Anisodus acutangulus TaxID=402998 RepID=A0A9Q1RRQ7_9SOLA|nr:hypothetical protein K7X08_006738 [Anisodus acutangulus]